LALKGLHGNSLELQQKGSIPFIPTIKQRRKMERQYDGVFFAWLFFAAMLIATGFILWQVHDMQFDTVNYDAWQEALPSV